MNPDQKIVYPTLQATQDVLGNIIQKPSPTATIRGSLSQPTQSVSNLNITTGNPALKTVFDSANQLLNTYMAQGRQLTPEIQQRIQAINDAEIQKQVAIAGARTAANNKDAPALDTGITTANTAEQTQQADIQSLLGELKTARESFIGSLAPTQGEQDLRTKLNTLRTERQLLPIELRQEGISAPGITGRQVEDERVRAIQEQNLLLEIGLKQDARKMTSLAYEKQIGFIRDDIELQNKIQQQLTDQENKVLEQARNLRKDSLSALGTITDTKGGWGGLAWEDLDPQSQADLINFIKPYPDLTISLVRDSLRITKQQQVFENSIATQKIKTSTLTGTGLSPEAEAVLNGTLRLEDLTPTTKGRIAGELSAAGYKSLPKLSSAQQEDLATMATVRGQIGQLEAFNKDGQLEGVGAFGLGSLKSLLAQIGLSSEEGMSVRALMGNIKGTLAKLRGGTSFTVNEEKLLDTYTPSINDNPAVIVNKMALLKDFIDSKEQNLRAFSVERVLPKETNQIEDLRTKYNY